MDSFYAGLPGTPFILKQRFPSVAKMTDEFNKQEEYTDVFYGEYCIIDTKNKSHPENGQIYRRGYSGPEYIGRVVGPSGLFCDNIRIITRDSGATVGEEYSDENGSLIPELTVCNSESGNWITRLKDSNNSENDNGSEENDSSESDGNNPEEQVLFFNPYNFETLDDKYKQKYKIIVYDIYENVSDEESVNNYKNETIATCFAGVYDVLESMQEYPDGQTVLRYSSSEDEILSETLVDKDGNSMVDEDDNKMLVSIVKSWLENVSFNPDTGQLIFTGNGCNETLNKVFFLKLLKNVKLDPDGTIHFLYTNEGEQGQPGDSVEESESLDKVLTWIKDAHLNKNTGQLQIHFNNDNISPVVIENLAAFDSHYNYKYSRIDEPKYYFKDILLEDDDFYVRMEEITEENFFEGSDYKAEVDQNVTIDNISGSILYPALVATTEKTDEYYSYKPCYIENPLEIEIEIPTTKKAYLDSLLIKTDKNNNPVKKGNLTKGESGLYSWTDSEENVLYYNNTGSTQIVQIDDDSESFHEKSKAKISFKEEMLCEIDWPLAEDGSFIQRTIDGVLYRKISFEKEVEETSGDKTGSLTFGEDDGSFSYKFIGQEGVSGQFNFIKKVEENNLGYTAVTNTKNQTSLSKTQNFRTPKKFFFFDGNTPSDRSFHLFANYSYPEPPEEQKLVPLSEKKGDDLVEVGAYYISSNLEKIYEGILSAEGEKTYREITDKISNKIFCYQETCYQIGENGAVEEFSIEKDYPFNDKSVDWEKNYPSVEKGYWKDLGKISDGLTNDLPSLLANIAYTVEASGVTSEDAKDKILWG